MADDWIERDGTPVEVSYEEYMRWRLSGGRDNDPRRVARTELGGGVLVSTVFLCHDHNYGGGRPILYETMILGGVLDGHRVRYHTREEALVGHEVAVQKAIEGSV